MVTPSLRASEIHVGTAITSITPDQPVALSGQMRTRIFERVASPITAHMVALESREGEDSFNPAIMVACDLVVIRAGILDKARERNQPRLPDFDYASVSERYPHPYGSRHDRRPLRTPRRGGDAA